MTGEGRSPSRTHGEMIDGELVLRDNEGNPYTVGGKPMPGRVSSSRTVAARAVRDAKKPGKWEGIVEVCKTCDRKATWPFCEHKTDDGSWYRLVVVREVGR